MKRASKPKNSWSDETKRLFADSWECWNCGQNSADCGHHIFGRGKEEGCEKSPLNYAFLCNHKCHLPRHGYWMSDEGRKRLLTQTLSYLAKVGYTLTKLDNEFLEKYGEEITRLKIKT